MGIWSRLKIGAKIVHLGEAQIWSKTRQKHEVFCPFFGEISAKSGPKPGSERVPWPKSVKKWQNRQKIVKKRVHSPRAIRILLDPKCQKITKMSENPWPEAMVGGAHLPQNAMKPGEPSSMRVSAWRSAALSRRVLSTGWVYPRACTDQKTRTT